MGSTLVISCQHLGPGPNRIWFQDQILIWVWNPMALGSRTELHLLLDIINMQLAQKSQKMFEVKKQL